MAGEDNSIFEEINEELKHDQLLMFLKKYQNVIFTVVAIIVIGIVAHSSWYARKNKQKEEVTTALLEVLQRPTGEHSTMVAGLLENAPSELKATLTLIASGEKLCKGDEKAVEALLEFSKKHGVDVIWKDLATLIYASYGLKPFAELIELLKPLTADEQPFRFSALELMGMIYENNGKSDKALECFDKITKHKEAPNTLKRRISILSNHIRNNLEK